MGQVLARVFRYDPEDGDGAEERNNSTTLSANELPLYVEEIRTDSAVLRPDERRDRQLAHAWCNIHTSPNVHVKADDPLTIHRTPIALSTDCARSKRGYSRGIHLFEISWPLEQRGTHAAAGVCTSDMPLQCNGYTCLVGDNTFSWGWDIVNQRIYHCSADLGSYPPTNSRDQKHKGIPATFFLILDMDEGTLAFAAEGGRYYGVAFRGLTGLHLYPVVSAVWGHCEVTLRYIGSSGDGVQSLLQLSRHKVREILGQNRLTWDHVSSLPIPELLKQYLCRQVPRKGSSSV